MVNYVACGAHACALHDALNVLWICSELYVYSERARRHTRTHTCARAHAHTHTCARAHTRTYIPPTLLTSSFPLFSSLAQSRTHHTPQVLEVFKAISDEDAIALGFDPNFGRPEWLILTVLPVPPLAVRPLVEMGGAKSHDDITFQLATIIKANNAIRQNEQNGAAPIVIEEAVEYLQFNVAAVQDNQMPHMPHTRSTSLHHDDADRQRKVSAFMNPAYEPRRKPRDRDSVYDSKRQSLAATSMCFNNPEFEAPHTDTDTHPHFDGSLA